MCTALQSFPAHHVDKPDPGRRSAASVATPPERSAAMARVSPLRVVLRWREQRKAKRTQVLAERILAVMRRRQADARIELLFSTELLTKFVGAESAEVFRALRKLERDGLVFRDDMTDRFILADKRFLKP
jgi:hypothetical protein